MFSGIFEFVKTVVDDEKNHFGLKSADESVKKEVMTELMKGNNGLIRSLKLGNVYVFVQLIFVPRWPMNQLNKNPNSA